MPVKIDPETVMVVEGPAYAVMSEDGPITTFNYSVVVTVGDADFSHNQSFPWVRQCDAEKLAERVKAAGEIDLQYWWEMEPALSLEERFDMYAEREQEVRWGLRSEEDMYHGIPYR